MTVPPYRYGDTILRVEGVNVAYDDNPVLRDVNVVVRDVIRPDVTQGQVIGLLAPSGMGKTTLFRVLAGLEQPNSGQVLVSKDNIPVRRGSVGVVAQNYPLFAHRTILGNLMVAAKMAGLTGSEAESTSKQMLARFNLESHGSKYPAQLSGGQRQRVAIAQQVICSDDLLLMDEPFSGLDLLAVDKVCKLIGEIAQSDELKTIIIVTHDISAAIEVADTLWILGRDRNAAGEPIPGARIQKEYNLIDRGLAWRDGITTSPEFHALVNEIRALYPKL